jgi:hypothetical protein
MSPPVTQSAAQRMIRAVSFAAAACLGAAASSTAFAAGPCEQPEYRAFDFWLGQWQVKKPDGQVVGTNRITREYNGCVVHEHYSTPRGYSGESLNTYDESRKVWHQTWVDAVGTLLLLEGGPRDGRMVLEGQTITPDRQVVRHRITWTPNADGTVRQLWESTGGDGNTNVVFDGIYVRK